MKIENIIEGYLKRRNKESLSKSDRDLAVSRLEICNKCPLFVNNVCSTQGEIWNAKEKKIVKGCGCNLLAKVFCKECSCPADKW